MKKFFAGFILGIFFIATLYFFFAPQKELKIYVGRLLDLDTIYLTSGTMLRGWIVKEDDERIWVETDKDSFTIPRSKCKGIQKNVLLRYLRRSI
ncbi:MAG: hypothetical protein ABID09_00440 [Candidatus Omnitrophota bacterium]